MNGAFKERCFTKYMEFYLKNPDKKITISFLCSQLNVSRQRFYNVFINADNFNKELIEYIATISFENITSIETLENSIVAQIQFYFKNASSIKNLNYNYHSQTIFINKINSLLINNNNLNLSKEQIDFIIGGFIKIIYDIRFKNLLYDEHVLNQYKKIIHSIVTCK